MIQEAYVSFESAKLLKEKGFNESARCWYDTYYRELHLDGCKMCNSDCIKDTFMAPTQQMAMRWLREVHNIHIKPCISYDTSEDADGNEVERWTFWLWEIFSVNSGNLILCEEIEEYDSYEQACEAAIKYCLENLIKDTDHE